MLEVRLRNAEKSGEGDIMFSLPTYYNFYKGDNRIDNRIMGSFSLTFYYVNLKTCSRVENLLQ